MSDYDVAICLNEEALNRIVNQLFQKPGLKTKLFTGTQTVPVMGVSVPVAWNVQQVPYIHLSPPTNDQWNHAIKPDGTASVPPQENSIVMDFSNVQVSKKNVSTGQNEQTTANFQALCTVSVSGNNLLTIIPLGALVELNGVSPNDHVLYQSFMIPKILQMAKTLVSGEQLPDLHFQGLNFGTPVLSLGSGRLVAVANLENKPSPSAPPAETFPNQPLTILLSSEAIQSGVSKGLSSFQGLSTGTGGSENLGIVKANYNANITVRNISASVNPQDLALLNVSVDLAASASAGADVFGPIGDVIVDGANAVADGVTYAANKVADAFKSY